MNQVNKHVLIIENSLNGLSLNESVKNSKGQDQYILGGIFTEFDKMNRNERIYTADKFLPHLDELNERKRTLGVIYGEFDHPDVFDTSLQRASHVIESVFYNQAENRVDGTIRLLSTKWGQEARAIVNDGLPLFVSSRAAGVTEGNGHVSVKKLFTYDAVADPGFGSAKMSSINESLGFESKNSNYRIYGLQNESKFNDLIMDNKNNEFVTKTQMDDYSLYLNEEIAKINNMINVSVKEGKTSPEQINIMAETQELLREQQTRVSGYLDYLAEQIQVAFNENKELKSTTEKLIDHNDHLVENLNKTIKYSEYLAEKLDKNIDYSEYIAETLDKNIDFSEYIAENVNKNIEFSDYLAESIEKSIDYAEYIAENLDSNIAYSEYLAENLDSNIAYSEYLAENLDSNINYSEYIAEHVDNNIAYAEYIAEHVDNNIAYSEYIAENVSDSQAYMNYIAEGLDNTMETLKSTKINEGAAPMQMPNMKVDDVSKYYDPEDDFVQTQGQAQAQVDGEPVQAQIDGEPVQAQIQGEPVQPGMEGQPVQGEVQPGMEGQPVQGEVQPGMEGEPVQGGVQGVQGAQEIPGMEEQPINPDAQAQIPGAEMPMSVENQPLDQAQFVNGSTIPVGDNGETGEVVASGENGYITIKLNTGEVQEIHESVLIAAAKPLLEQEELTKTIRELILETKKRKASEEKVPHFIQFLTENNKKAWYDLLPLDKEKVIFAINESKTPIYSESQLLNAINESLSVKVSDEEVLVNNMPSSLVPHWNKLDETIKTSVLSQAKLYPNLNTTLKMEKFWESRNLVAYSSINETKTVLNENKVVSSDTLSDDQIDAFISKLQNLR